MAKEGSTKIVNYTTPGAGVLVLERDHINYIVKIHYFFINILLYSILLYSQAYIRQTRYIVIMTKEGSTKFVNSMTPGAGVLVLGRGHINHKANMHYLLLY